MLLLQLNGLHTFFLGDDFDILRKTVAHRGLSDALRMTFVGNWGPVSYVQFYLDYLIGGLDPFVYHLNNVLWLGVAVVGMFGLVRTIWPDAAFPAWAAALLLATHPSNDQAVNYICARSHTVAAALGLVSLALYARFRLRPGSGVRRLALVSAALTLGFLAGLSKESALTLPVWTAAFEWLFVRGDGEPVGRRVMRAVGSGALFALAAAGVFVVRRLAVGGTPRHLEQASFDLGRLWRQFAADLPVYGLAGGLPFPFSWIDLGVLDRFRSAGWAFLVAGVAAGALCLVIHGRRRIESSRAAGLYVLGLTIAAVTLMPTVYAGLQIQRRYLFISNVGFVLMATAVLVQLDRHFPRRARALAALLVLAGAAGTLQRNDLHRRTGAMMQRLIEDARGAPLGAPAPSTREPQRIVLVTLPRYVGGDRVSGALLMHRTDLYSALHLYGITAPRVYLALQCDHAQDYSTEARFETGTELLLTVSFRQARAFAAALARDPEEDGRGEAAFAELISADSQARVLTYRVQLQPDFWDDPEIRLLVFDDGVFQRLVRGHPDA